MKRKIKAAKKGMVLVLTSVILFVATSIVAVLSTFVIITRNQKIENEYVSRTKIALKNMSLEIYSKVLLNKFIRMTETPNDIQTVTVDEFAVAGIQFSKPLNFTCHVNPYAEVSGGYYYEYSFDSSALAAFSSGELRDIGITTIVTFDAATLDKTDSYKIEEMRFY